LTGVEAIANAVPAFRRPRVKNAQNTEALLGITLGLMLIGLAILIRKIQKGTDNVVICRLHFRRSIWSAQS
jgi:hypothetical protein